MARQDSLTTAADQAASRLAELDAVPISQRARMSYTGLLPNGQTFGWNEYRDHLIATIKELQAPQGSGGSLIQQAGGPFDIWA